MAGQFYVTLPSNSSMNYFPQNTITSYNTKLSEQIRLTGEWEVGIAEIHYPHSWFNVDETNNKFYVNTDTNHEIIIPSGYYTSGDKLIDEINNTLRKNNINDVQFRFLPTPERVGISTGVNASIRFLEGFQTLLGFELNSIPELSSVVAKKPINIHYRVPSLYVYTDIIEYQRVGDVSVPLLRILQTKESDIKKDVFREFIMPHYKRVVKKDFDTILIDLRSDTGEKISFQRGRLLVKLHFRQSRSSYLV